MASDRKIIAVVGATGLQGGGVVNALKVQGTFAVRALTRKPESYSGPADEAIRADLDQPETLKAAFAGAYGVFVVTNFWDKGGEHVDEIAQGKAAVQAAKDAGVEHFVWSTLPDVEAISGGKYKVPHFTGKANVNQFVKQASFRYHTLVEAPFYYQNLRGIMAPQPQEDGRKAWVLPIASSAKGFHMGDIHELGHIVAAAFARPDQAGDGQPLALAGDLLSFDDVVSTLNAQGHNVAFQQVSGEVFAGFFPGADEMVQMLGYFAEHTYMGPDADAKIRRAQTLIDGDFTDFTRWAQTHYPVNSAS